MKSWRLLGEPPRTLKETMMEAEYNHLNHATWECKYHVVFTPKYRKKLLFGKIKRHLGQVFHDLARRKECRIEDGHLMPIMSTCDIDTSEVFGGADHRVYEGEEFDYGSCRMSSAR
jgi:Transposase IS200 like